MEEYPWLAHYPESVDWNQKISVAPAWQLLEDSVQRFPNHYAIDFLGNKYRYADLWSAINRAAAGLKELGVEQGTRVGIFLPNCPQFVISYFAILRAGGTVVNFSPLYAEKELQHQAEDSEVEIMITLDMEALYPKAHALLGKGKLRHLVISSLAWALPFPKSYLFPILKRKEIVHVKKDTQHTSWQELLRHPPINEPAIIDPEQDIAVIQYTGGTTGVPKGAMLSHANVYINAVQSGMWFGGLEEGKERMLAVLPFFHVFAMTAVMNFSLLKGAMMIIHPRFEIDKVLRDIDKKKPTLMPGVPTMFTAINNYPHLKRYDLTSLKACISGGAGLPVEVKKQFESLTGCVLIEGYGLTETSPVCCANPLTGENKAGSIGLPLPQTIIKIEDIEQRGTFVPVRERGELCVIGPQVMKGYWNKPKETSNVLKDGLLRTGDIALMDEEGYVYIVDRLKELIIAGGFNIYPRHIEEAIYRHEDVLETAVIGVKDDYRGEAVKAFVALKPGKQLDADTLRLFLKERLGKHEIPTYIEFRDELPKTMIGKINKKELAS